jgi:signal transduction histidine kinase
LKDIDELERIADSAIFLVREDTSPTSIESIDLAQLIREVVRELRDLDYNVELAELPAACVRASPLALRRAFRNLLINAATHGKAARVRMSADAARATVIIEDEGPGIPPELLGQVFEPFFRVDPARRQNVPGAGLGLTIAREIVRRTGGDIEIANRKPHGLVQHIFLPLSRNQGKAN